MPAAAYQLPLIATPPRANPSPDYPALVDVLLNLRQPPDQAGETTLTRDEAAKIRACGVEACAGRWYCPRLPHSVVGPLRALRHLSADIDLSMRPVPWREKRAAIRHVTPIDSPSKFDRRLIRRLQNAPGQCLPRSALKRTHWRRGAQFVQRTIDHLRALDRISEHQGLLYPFSKAELEERLEAQKRPRRLVPISTIY
jgi:hypothetical protein